MRLPVSLLAVLEQGTVAIPVGRVVDRQALAAGLRSALSERQSVPGASAKTAAQARLLQKALAAVQDEIDRKKPRSLGKGKGRI